MEIVMMTSPNEKRTWDPMERCKFCEHPLPGTVPPPIATALRVCVCPCHQANLDSHKNSGTIVSHNVTEMGNYLDAIIFYFHDELVNRLLTPKCAECEEPATTLYGDGDGTGETGASCEAHGGSPPVNDSLPFPIFPMSPLATHTCEPLGTNTQVCKHCGHDIKQGD